MTAGSPPAHEGAASEGPIGHVYLAGPEVFFEGARTIAAAKRELCARHGLVGHFPLDAAPAADLRGEALAMALFDGCVAMMGRCDLAIVNMTPFRGVSMDVGSAVEMGYLFGSGKPVLAYTDDEADYRTRVEAAGRADGAEVEDFGLADNLMCEGVVRRSGGSVVRGVPGAGSPAESGHDLAGFHACLHQARDVLRSGPARPRRRSG
jgi:nucleoside 2-deoxyribosyltransferase